MKRAMSIIFILLNVHIILGDDHCEAYYDDDDECKRCEKGYYLYYGECEKNLCVECQNEDCCEMCSDEGRCLSCYSDDYSVYGRYLCKKRSLVCGNNTVYNCEKCEIVNNIETGSCGQCYDGYISKDKSCIYSNIEIIKMNKFLNYFIILFLLLSN